MQNILPGKVRPFTLTRPNTQCRSVEQSHAYKTCLAYVESPVQAPVILSPLWQVNKILPVEMPLCFALLTEETPTRPLLLVEKSSVSQMKGKPWLGRFLPDLLPPPRHTDPPPPRLRVRCSYMAFLAPAKPQTSPQFCRAGLAHCLSGFALQAKGMVLVHDSFSPHSLNIFPRNTQPHCLPPEKLSLLRGSDTKTLPKGHNSRHDPYMHTAQIKDAADPLKV